MKIEKYAQLRKEIRKRLAEKKQGVKLPPPPYDDIYFQGLEVLARL